MSWLSRFFGPQIDPATPVSWWTVDMIRIEKITVANKTHVEDSTWGKMSDALTKSLPITHAEFNAEAPLFVVLVFFNGKTLSVKGYTEKEFNDIFGSIATRTTEERKVWLDSVSEMLQEMINCDKAILANIAELKTSLSGALDALDKLIK